ncbi:wax ester/triacylglycerol synthase family O-acyltransferase [Piscinibacter sakaiensis]|uniref:wax ester/triacylglycerol synthase family O-acyltransferase n=1 Tax=Piscinibacter sakaiensis TaxID=1547922 RepID=UPI003AAE553C
MSRVDTAWLRMDSDVNLMMIVGVWLLSPAISRAALIERLASRLLLYPRFRQSVVDDPVGPIWRNDASFDIEQHVVQTRLPRRRGQSERAALQALIGKLAVTPLDPTRPLWQLHLVDGYEGGSALIARIHHCIGDGIALISVMLSITDEGADPPRSRRGGGHSAAGASDPGLFDELLKPLGEIAAKAFEVYERGLGKAAQALADPHRPLLESLQLARGVQQMVGDVAALALMEDDSPTRLKGKPGGRKLVAWGEPLPLERVKAVGKALGCSVNDVLLACVAGAFGSYLHSIGDDPDGKEIRVMVPVNLRPLDEAWQLGNRFGLVPLVLPIGLANPVQRVYAVRARMNGLKGSFQPLLAFGLLAMAGLLIKPLQDSLLGLFAKKATAVMTNVPGPAEALTFCGSTLRQTMFWVPQSGDIGVGVSVLSYGGGVQFGLITDRRLCPDPQAVVDRFEPEFDKLLMLTMMLPWRE